MVLGRNDEGLVVIAIEGKVAEAFGPTVAERRKNASEGVDARIAAIEGLFAVGPAADTTRYQLMHRTASAILTARAFHARAAMMLVHSFSPEKQWFGDFASFCRYLGVQDIAPGQVRGTEAKITPPLFVGWCQGDARFLLEHPTLLNVQ